MDTALVSSVRDMLAAYPLAGFVPMKGAWRADRAAVRNARRQAPLGRQGQGRGDG